MQNILKIDIHDISTIKGRFVVQIDNDDYRNSIINEKGEVDLFWVEKRISHVVQVKNIKEQKFSLAGFYYPHSKLLSPEELVQEINSEEESRHYRLLTPKELVLAYEAFFESSDLNARFYRESSIKRSQK